MKLYFLVKKYGRKYELIAFSNSLEFCKIGMLFTKDKQNLEIIRREIKDE